VRLCLPKRVVRPARVVAKVVLPDPSDVEGEAAGLVVEQLTVSLVKLLVETEPGNLKEINDKIDLIKTQIIYMTRDCTV
jgi:hypothetical protein